MSAVAIITLKIMPESPNVPLAEIKKHAQSFMEQHGARSTIIEEQSIAFGLKALIVKAGVPEEKGSDFFEAGLAKIKHVSSVTIEDYRRAFG